MATQTIDRPVEHDVQRWEYVTFDLVKRKGEIEELNRLGREGWEAVAMVSSWASGRVCAPHRAAQTATAGRRLSADSG